MKPLFIPLKTEYYEAFKRGEKTTEYRKRGPRWNAYTCAIGRRVTLSKGYGKKHRLQGTVVGFSYNQDPIGIPGWVSCYGPHESTAACITIKLDDK